MLIKSHGNGMNKVKDYHINIFYSDEDEGYIADIPDLKFCSAFGYTQEEGSSALCVLRDTTHLRR
jgi:hypothetical protein